MHTEKDNVRETRQRELAEELKWSPSTHDSRQPPIEPYSYKDKREREREKMGTAGNARKITILFI